MSADGGAKTKKKKKKIRKDDATPTISVTENPPIDAVAPVTPKRRVKVKKSTDDAKSPRSSNKSSTTTTTTTTTTVVNNKASHSDEAAHAVGSSTRRHAHASGSTASDDSGGGGDANSLNVPTVDSSKKKSRKSIAAAIDGSSSSAGSFSVKRHVKKVFGFGSFLSGTRSSKADDEQRADPSIDMGVVNEMLDALGDNNNGTAARGGGNNVTTAAARSSPFRDTNGPFSSASSQVDDTDDDLPASLQRRTSSARYQLLRQRSQVVNQQYEGAKRQLQRLVSDSSMRSSDPDELAAESPPLSPTSDTSGSPTKGITMPPQQRSVVKRSSSVSIDSPGRIRRQPRQAILAPTRVAPTPVVVPPIVTRRSASGDDVPPPQYTLAPPSSSNGATPSSSARPARDATTAAFLACMYEVSQMREKIHVTASAADAHSREVSQVLAQEQSNNAAQLREVDSKLDKSETSLRTVRDSIQKLENRIQVVKRAQRNANVALKAGQLLPVLGLMALFVYGLRLLIYGGSLE